MAKVSEVCENPEAVGLVIRYLSEEIVVKYPKNFPCKAFNALFDGYLIGYLYPWHPKG